MMCSSRDWRYRRRFRGTASVMFLQAVERCMRFPQWEAIYHFYRVYKIHNDHIYYTDRTVYVSSNNSILHNLNKKACQTKEKMLYSI